MMKKSLWIGFIVLGFGLLAFLGMRGFFADSEIWSTTLGFHLSEEWRHHWVHTRPMFYLPLYLVTVWTDGGFETLLAARALFVLNALLILILVFRIGRRLQGTEAGLWAVTFLVIHSGFVHQSYRIRSDLLAVTFMLLAIDLSLRSQKGRYFWLPLLATPKGVVNVIAALPFFWRQVKAILGQPKKLVFTVLALIIGAGLLASAYSESLSYFISTFHAGSGSPAYMSRASFSYVIRFIASDPLFYLLYVLSLAWLLTKAKLGDDTRKTVWASLGLTVLGLLMTEKVPFFIASWIPLQALVVGLWLARIPSRAAWGLALLQVGFFAPNYVDFIQRGQHTEQRRVAEEIQLFLESDSSRSYYDTVGMIPGQARLRYFVGPNQVHWNKAVIPQLSSALPTLILYSKKAQSLEPELSDLLDRHYIDLGNGFYVRGELTHGRSSAEISEFIGGNGQAVVTLELERVSPSGESERSVVVRDSAEVLSLLRTYSSQPMPFGIRKVFFGDTRKLAGLPRADTVLRFDSEF